MRKITSAIMAFAFLGTTAVAQNQSFEELPDSKSELGSMVKAPKVYRSAGNGPETPLWSEDFSGGIPMGWVNAGFDDQGNSLTNALWEYRGPNTTPNDTVGSRGAFVGTLGPVQSATRSNGFMIFDSDFLDNGGNSTGAGTGLAAAPHIGTLTTGTIDMSMNPYIELSFHSYYREFQARVLVAFSSDNGLTWPDTAEIHTDVVVNERSTPEGKVSVNISDYLGNESQGKIRFIFDGTLSNANGSGYYFWMIDDIEINELPKHEMRFTDWNLAPALDMIFGPATGSTNAGHMALSSASTNATDQTRDLTFDCNVYNYGYRPQTNVMLTVEVRSGGSLVTSRTSGTTNLQNPNDTATWQDLNTTNNPWKPTAVGDYDIVYIVSSDSATAVSDTFQVAVDPVWTGTDFNSVNSSFGTENLAATDGMIYSPEIDLVQSGKATSLWVAFSTTTVAGGLIEVQIYDTAGNPVGATDPMNPQFLKGTSATAFGNTTSDAYTITATDIANGFADIPLTDGTNPYIDLPAGGYSINLILFSNNGNNPVQILNDETFSTSGRRLLFVPGDRWYGGFTSLIFNAPFARLTFAPNVDLPEDALKAAITVAPNPATDFVAVEFTDVEGSFDINMMDITGRLMVSENVNVLGATKHNIDVSAMPAGVYMLNVNNGSASVTYKITVQ